MVLEFILLFRQLNLVLLSSGKREEVIEKTYLILTKLVKIFEYKKNNNKYWDGAKVYKQVVNKKLLIIEILCHGYSLLFCFDNAISHLVNAKDILYIKDLNKSIEGKQLQLRNRQFSCGNISVDQLINF